MYLSRLGSAASPYLSLILRMMACFSPFLWLFGPCTWTTHSPFSLHLSLVGTWDLADEDSWFCLDRVPCNWVTLPTNLVDEPREDLPPSSCRLSGGAHLFLFALSVPPFGHCLFCLVRKPHPWVALAKYVRNQLEAIVAVVLRQLANASAAIPCSNCSRVFDPCMLLDASCSTPPAPLYRSVLNGPSVSGLGGGNEWPDASPELGYRRFRASADSRDPWQDLKSSHPFPFLSWDVSPQESGLWKVTTGSGPHSHLSALKVEGTEPVRTCVHTAILIS